MKILRPKKHPLLLQKATLETKESNNYAEEHSAKEAKVLLLKTKNGSEDAIAEFKLKAEHLKEALRSS